MPGSAVLLQATSTYFGQFGSSAVPLWLAIPGIAVIVAIVVFAVLAVRRSPGRAATPEQQARFARRTFAKTARAAGLSRDQAAMLERLVEVCKVKQPLLVFSSSGLLDDVLKRGIYQLENASMPEPKRQAQLRLIYTTKQLVENSSRRGGGIRSTLMLKPGQAMSVRPDGGTGFSVKLVANTREVLAVTTPRLASGQEQRWPKGTRCTVGFTREAEAGYAFPSKVMGYNPIRGAVCMLLQHAKTLSQEQQRRSRRKTLSRPCYCYPVKIVETGTGRKAQRRAVVQQNEKVMGTVSDISAGGCSVRARQPLKPGTLVKVELSITRRDTLAAFGKVQRVRQERQGGMMHVMFTRMSAITLNKIYSYVYDYAAMG
jgi:c-di-GMP-binding flagellar brake protein YcgR